MRLEVTRRADLATRALVELGQASGRTKAGTLADRLGTSPGFLHQAVGPLAARGWIHSEPGPSGGYAAAVDLESLSVLKVIEAVEGPTDTGRCVLEDRACDAAGTCALHRPWSAARQRLTEELAATPVAALSHDSARVDGAAAAPRPGGPT